jgi:AraC-like DNA-binding protein
MDSGKNPSMKVLAFTIPVAYDKTVIVKDETLPHFYPYLHRHEEIQITYIQEGEGTLIIGNSMQPFSSGEIYVIGVNVPHVFKSDPSYFTGDATKRVRASTVYFSLGGALSYLFELPELTDAQKYFLNLRSGFKVPQEAVAQLSAQLLNICSTTALDQLIVFLKMLETVVALGEVPVLSPGYVPKLVREPDDILLARISAYLMQHYHRDITLDEVAATAYMTPQAFCRYFKKHTQLTFVSYLNKMRINEACRRLLDGSFDSIAEVASECGFKNITNFNRVFKLAMGVSPRKYIHESISNTSQLAERLPLTR